MDVEEYRAFVAVVDHGSFTGAAQALGVSKSYVSKQVTRLEERLCGRLLNRTTRRVTATDAGVAFAARARDVLERIDEAEADVSDHRADARGTLRVSLPVWFGVEYVAPLIPRLLDAHPRLRIDADFSDRKVDIVGEGYDVVVRIGPLADTSLVAKKLAPVQLLTVASPAYLARAGTPRHPDDLVSHQCLQYGYLAASHEQTWRFVGAGGEVAVRATGRLLATSGDALLRAAREGLGVVRVPDFMVRCALHEGALVPVLEPWAEWTGAIWAVFPHSRHLPAKVRAFVDLLAAELPGALVMAGRGG